MYTNQFTEISADAITNLMKIFLVNINVNMWRNCFWKARIKIQKTEVQVARCETISSAVAGFSSGQ